MTHYFEKTIVDAKTIYTDYLLNVLTPILYYGIKTIYDEAKDMENQIKEAEKISPDIKNPGVLQLFQLYLAGLDQWTDPMMEQETNRIRSTSGCADIFDDLIRAVIKSHIIVLTYTASEKTCRIIKERLHEKVQIKSFIHCCYLECAKIFFDHPTLFYHEFLPIELKENERKIYQLIKIGIKTGIKRVLPMKQILETYLGNDYIEVNDNEEEKYMKVKDLIGRDLYGIQKNDNHSNDVDEGGIRQLIDDFETPVNHELDKIESLIFGNNRILDETAHEAEILKEEPVLDQLNYDNDKPKLISEHSTKQLIKDRISPMKDRVSPTKDKTSPVKDRVSSTKDRISPVKEDEIIKPEKEMGQMSNAEEVKIIKSLEDDNDMITKISDQNIQGRFNNIFMSKGRAKKGSSDIIKDAMRSLKHTEGDDIKIERSGKINSANDNDNYFEGMAN